MKVCLCYKTLDNAEVTLCHAVAVALVSTYIHPPWIPKYCDFRSWWTSMAWYFTDQLNSDQVSKELVTLAFFLWRAAWVLTNGGQLMWINYWIIQCRRRRYHHWCKIISIWVTVLSIKAQVITNVATTNTLWTWHDECNMSMWWYFVHIFFVYGQQKVRSNFFVWLLLACLIFSTRNKTGYELFVLI